MAYNAYLEDEVSVTITQNEQLRCPDQQLFGELYAHLRRAVNNLKSRAKNRVGKAVAQEARRSQESSIRELDAICSGKLFKSIRITGRGGNYIIGTNLSDKGYYYLVHGRRSITIDDPDNPQHVMSFRPKCKSKFVHTKHVGPAAPKDYMLMAAPKTKAKINSIVEAEIQQLQI